MSSSSMPHIVEFARLAAVLLAATDTPSALRDSLLDFVAELRHALTSDEQRRTQGIEAEAIILSYAQPPGFPELSSLVQRESLQERPGMLPELRPT
jgi:hypothetical protein